MNLIKVPYIPYDSLKNSEELLGEIEDSNEKDSNENENTFFKPNVENLSEEMQLILHGMGMEKYMDLFDKRRVHLETFLKLDERDLKELGINDPNDLKTFLKKLGTEQKNDSEFIVNENHFQDFRIAKIVSQQLVLLEHYCAYVELQMKKNEVIDFNISPTECASLYLKAFTEGALIQSRILCGRVYDEHSDTGLIDKVLRMYNLTLPAVHQRSLPKKKRKGSSTTRKIVTTLGLSSLIIIIGKYLMRLN